MGRTAAKDFGRVVRGIHVHGLARAQCDLHALTAGEGKSHLSGAQGYSDNRGVGMHLRLVARLAAELQYPDLVVLFNNLVMIRCYRYGVCYFFLLQGR